MPIKKSDISMIVDWENVLDVDDDLVKKLAAYHDEGARIYVCSNEYNEDMNYLLKRRGLDLDYLDCHILNLGKQISYFWAETAYDMKLKPEQMLVLDDDPRNCKAASESGFEVIEWHRDDADRFKKLDKAVSAVKQRLA